jgi:hypothetical protein
MLTRAEYEYIRFDPRRFVMIAGHELPEIESVVQRRAGYVAIEKRDAAGGEAAELDSRS